MINTSEEEVDSVPATEVAEVVLSGLSGIDITGPKKKAVCLSLRLGLPGIKKKVSSEEVTADTDKSMLDVFKHILDSPELGGVRKVDVQIRQAIMKKSYSTKYLHQGIFLVPLGLVEQLDAELEALKVKREEAIEAFLEAYPEAIEESKVRLKGLFSENDYPTVDDIKDKFRFQVRYVNFDVSGTLEEVSSALFNKQKEKAEKDWENAAEEIRQALRLGMSEMVDKLCDRLSPDSEGKPKRFKAGTIDAFNEFLTTFEHRDLTNDGELKTLVSSARAALKGASAIELRKNKDVRTSVLDSFKEIKSKLDRLDTAPVGRKVVFDDED